MKHAASKIDFANFHLLKDLSEGQIQEFLNIVSLKTGRKGDVIYSKSETNKLYFLHSGAVKMLEIKENGVEAVKDILTENEWFGGFSHDQNEASQYEYAKVLTTRATYFVTDLSRFRQLLKDNPSISFNFYCIMARKINRLENRCSNLVFNDTRDRLIHFLREMATRESDKSNGTLAIRNFLTQNEMARMIYVSRQTLSRVLKELRSSGELIYTRSKIELKTKERAHLY